MSSIGMTKTSQFSFTCYFGSHNFLRDELILTCRAEKEEWVSN
jgi:hypothetical protein